MKIGILTFHCAHNYGAVLQCYALQEVLQAMGHKVEIIDYRPDYLVKQYQVFYAQRLIQQHQIKSVIKACVNEILTFWRRVKRYNAFMNFIETNLNLSRPVKEKNIPSIYDAYVIGSDQIWNPKITKGFKPIYFCFFPFSKGEKKYIAYAASMEAASISNEVKSYYVNALGNFDSISVREEILEKLLQPLTDKKINIVLDPTLLANPAIWHAIALPPRINEKYVFVYQVRRDKNASKIAHHIARQLHSTVVEVTGFLSGRYLKNTYQSCSPEQFLGWIKHAECIVTTSFHGTAFSVVFNKPFYSLKGKDDTRAISLLNALHLENRLINSSSAPVFENVDYSRINPLLMNLRKQSMEYLLHSLKNE